eukprot:CAMPEP_0118700730 /NCGR_PEP_ID=MMETSP0800-20121206/16770_1 /TAXON_ID=210618 ORGANISM="Striatella unipunctata, Strain CCMP2910" /NCGR_SAMPLE_ID=MMETSP0800 /ASSEMBLY_ACC=CAM_ASM_000638 /LENGTH=225 /DNA_ID=CAMNT_0006601397 /DNA_START=48 /DNA_END=721 /DNA_ORIENTATION=-
MTTTFRMEEEPLYDDTAFEFSRNDGGGGSGLFSEKGREILNMKIAQVRRKLEEEEERRGPPSPNLSAHEFVTAVLDSLQNANGPLPFSGVRTLLRASTPRWRDALRSSVGAPPHATEQSIATALGTAMARPNNQFSILVTKGDSSPDGHVEWTFPTDLLEMQDGECWLECRLRSKKDNRLLVATGWQLQRSPQDGSWLLDGLDWQDFRDAFRPGIGREEWSRICG